MLPEWMLKKDEYIPMAGSGRFIFKNLSYLGKLIEKLQFRQGKDKLCQLPSLWKLIGLVIGVIIVSLSNSLIVNLILYIIPASYILMWSKRDQHHVLILLCTAGAATAIMLLPAMLMNHHGIYNDIRLILKVIICTELVAVFNYTTKWHEVTAALRQLRIPAIFVFTLDITIRYIFLLGNLLEELLAAVGLRSVGKNAKKYQSVGGIIGMTFVKSSEMSREMYEAMQCRCFTDDYQKL